MSAVTLIVIVVVIILLFGGIGTAPIMPYNRERSWGWAPSGGLLGLLVIILLVLLLTGNLGRL